MPFRHRVRVTVAIILVMAFVAMPAIAFAQEDHSHGEGSILWPCGVFMASIMTAALSFGGWFLQTRAGGSTMGMSSLFDLSAMMGGSTPPAQAPPAQAPPAPASAASAPASTEQYEEQVPTSSTDEETPYEEEPPETPSDEEAPPKKVDTQVTVEEMRKAPKHTRTRFNPVTKKIEVRQGDTWVEAGLKGGYYGKGGGPGHDPFKDAPPVADARLGDVTVHKREDLYSAKAKTGKSGADTTLTHNAADGTTTFKRKDFSLKNRDQEWVLSDKVGGDKIGIRFDGSTDDFTLWRNRFTLDRKGDAWTAANKPKKGTEWAAVYDPSKEQYGVVVGDRGAGREGDDYFVNWGRGAAGANPRFDRYTFGHKTGGGKVYHEYTMGRDGQTGFSRSQPVKMFGQDAELTVGFENYLKEFGGAERMTRQRSIGIESGKFKLEFTRQDGDFGGKMVSGAYTKRF